MLEEKVEESHATRIAGKAWLPSRRLGFLSSREEI
jgi:hypothetical protein